MSMLHEWTKKKKKILNESLKAEQALTRLRSIE